MLDTLQIYEELKKTFDSDAAKNLAELFGRLYREISNTVTKTEFNELKDVVRELAEAQKRTEQRVEELAEVQKRTELEVRRLADGLLETRRMVGGLSDTVGYTLENEAYRSLPQLLKRDFGIETEGRLIRKYIEYEDGRHDEINIFGRAIKDGRTVWVIGEAKVRISKKELNDFLKMVKRIDRILEGEKILIAVTHTVLPALEKYAESKGIKIYWSYEF